MTSGKRATVKFLFSFLFSLCFYLAATAYALELYLTYFSDEAIRISDWKGKGYDVRSKEDVLRDLQMEGKNPVLSLVPKFLVDEPHDGNLFPLGGISGRVTVLCNETGAWAIYDSDEHGFNNPKGLYAPGIDALLVGESFVHGACVAPDETIAARLRARYPATVSLGMDGNGALATLASLVEFAPALKPKKILWVYVENTLGRVRGEMKVPQLAAYLAPDGNHQALSRKQAEVDTFWQRYIDLKLQGRKPEAGVVGFDMKRFLALYYVRKHVAIARYGIRELRNASDRDGNEAIFKNILLKAKVAAAQQGSEFYFVYLGVFYPGKDEAHSDHDRMLALAESLGLRVIDGYTAMKNMDPAAINAYGGRGHYNAYGYRVFSDVILDALAVSEQAIDEGRHDRPSQ